MNRVFNFSAGPAALPLEVLEQAQRELLDFGGSGMSVMEQSHRGKTYEGIHMKAIARLRRLMQVPDDYSVMFVQGGASMQFAMVPLNFLGTGRRAAYVVNGTWGEKALAEAKLAAMSGRAEAIVAATSRQSDGGYQSAPPIEAWSVPDDAAYVHYASNETVHGIQYGIHDALPSLETSGVSTICDMSSDILWRPINVADFSLIYAGAQKNLGPSGVTLVIAKRAFLESGARTLPRMLQYRTHDESDSLYNTPPTFAIYLVDLVLGWIEKRGGLEVIESANRAKARAIYNAIEVSDGYYRSPVEASQRSVMNVVFRLPDEAAEEAFVAKAEKAGLVGLKGHRSAGGIRVSLYNAVTLEGAERLAGFMGDFRRP
jgi:phosphoserine aminotransferase